MGEATCIRQYSRRFFLMELTTLRAVSDGTESPATPFKNSALGGLLRARQGKHARDPRRVASPRNGPVASDASA